MQVQNVFCYPLKGARPIEQRVLQVKQTGFNLDRILMVCDADTGKMITQREAPLLATVEVSLLEDADFGDTYLQLSHISRYSSVRIDPYAVRGGIFKTDIFGNTVHLVHISKASKWLSGVLDRNVVVGIQSRYGAGLLIDAIKDQYRRLHEIYNTPEPYPMSLADSGPYLITTTGSLAALNVRLKDPLPMSRFRPNIVIDAPAWAENEWKVIRIGEAVFEVGEYCTRCGVTTTDQQSGIKKGPEPLRALSHFRMLKEDHMLRDSGVVFGVKARLLSGEGAIIKARDSLEVIQSRLAPSFEPEKLKPQI